MSDSPRKPAAFRLGPAEEPAAAEAKPAAKPGRRRKAAGPEIVFEPEPPAAELVPVQLPERTVARRFRWGAVLMSSLATLFTMGAGLAASRLVEDLFARSVVLGWVGTGFLALAGLAALAIAAREIAGLVRIRRLGTTQADAARAVSADDAAAARQTLADLRDIYGGRSDMAWAMARLREQEADIMDPADRVRLAERDLMAALDAEAGRVIARAARRVSLLTAVTPVAAVDILFAAAQNLRMLRELATLYGGRPGTLGTLKLARMVVSHLAVTGGLALSDSLIQHIVGRGLIGRLSARFGEGAVNGILTARIGLAAIDLCRPLPFLVLAKPGLGDFLREVVNVGGGRAPRDSDARTG